jgi:hypothetical protein
MNSDQIASIIEGLIPLLLGIFFTLRGYGFIGKKPDKLDLNYQKIEQSLRMFRQLGPIVILFGIILCARVLIQK